MNSKDNFLNSKVKGFNLCKSSSLNTISDECRDWVNFIHTYFQSDFSINIKQFVAQSQLSQLEPLLHFKAGAYVSDYIDINNNKTYLTLQITQKRADFVDMVQKYKYIYDRLNHIQELSAFKPAEVPTYKGNIQKYLNSLSDKDNVLNCIYDIANSEQCLQQFIDSALSIENEIGNFLIRFNELKHFRITLADSYCLPRLLSWEYSREINFNFFFNSKYQTFPYLSVNEIDEISCQRIHENNDTYYSFNCNDNIIPMQFFIEKDKDGSLMKRRLICRNGYLNHEEELYIDMNICNHFLAFNISDYKSLN